MLILFFMLFMFFMVSQSFFMRTGHNSPNICSIFLLSTILIVKWNQKYQNNFIPHISR